MVVVLIESADALFRNNQFFADALFTDFYCTMVIDNENAFHLSSVSIEKISQYIHIKPNSEPPVPVCRPDPGYTYPFIFKVTSHETIPCSLMWGSP